jgi:hypothetical protein
MSVNIVSSYKETGVTAKWIKRVQKREMSIKSFSGKIAPALKAPFVLPPGIGRSA